MYNEELENLIDAALTDGVLTEKEKQILFKKAQAMGVDLDEFEMVLDARLVKLKKAEQEKGEKDYTEPAGILHYLLTLLPLLITITLVVLIWTLLYGLAGWGVFWAIVLNIVILALCVGVYWVLYCLNDNGIIDVELIDDIVDWFGAIF